MYERRYGELVPFNAPSPDLDHRLIAVILDMMETYACTPEVVS